MNYIGLGTLAFENVCGAWEARMRTDAAKLNPDILAFIKTVPTLSAPFLRKLEKSLNTLGDIHVLGRTVGNETRSYVGVLAMLKGVLKSNNVLAVTGSTDLIQKIDTFNIVSKKVVDCTVGVNLCEGKSMIGQDLIDKAIDALHKATKVNTSLGVNYQETITELDKSMTGLEDILRGAEGHDGIGEACTQLTAANVQYKKLSDGISLANGRPTRLQLQAACVKAGLDSTPGNDDLKKALQKYWDENNQAERFSLEVEEEHETNETNAPAVVIAETTASFEITSTTITTTSTEGTKSQDNSEDGPTDKELEAEEIAVKLEVKLGPSTEQNVVVKEEAVNIQEPAKNSSESTSTPTASATNKDSQVEKETLVEEATETTIKKEEDVPVKEEEAHSEEKSLLQPKVEYDDDIKPEDIPAVPVSERAQFWESKASTTTTTTTTTSTSTPRSNLPVSKTRCASSQKPQTSKSTAQKRKSEEDTEVKKEGADNINAESPSSSLPTPGTVRKMIGRFATSGSKRSPAAEPPVAPLSPSKKRRVDSPMTSSSVPTPGPSTPGPSTSTPSTPSKHSALKNKVVKIPVATSAKAKNVYATPRVVGTPTIRKSTTPTPKASETGKTVAIRRQKAIVEAASEGRPARRTSARLAAAPLASSSSTSTSTSASTTTTTTTTRTSSKSVSAETINRLATPKKVNASVLASTTTPASFAMSVGPATPTRPRGPVLSTASRAAQRSHRKKD
ncbi:hypothetical protein BGZ82_005609 [Podila clonocystis]|nr:hypothetical protein BGZ82_005609 [Podila clonocystis]